MRYAATQLRDRYTATVGRAAHLQPKLGIMGSSFAQRGAERWPVPFGQGVNTPNASSSPLLDGSNESWHQNSRMNGLLLGWERHSEPVGQTGPKFGSKNSKPILYMYQTRAILSTCVHLIWWRKHNKQEKAGDAEPNSCMGIEKQRGDSAHYKNEPIAHTDQSRKQTCSWAAWANLKAFR